MCVCVTWSHGWCVSEDVLLGYPPHPHLSLAPWKPVPDCLREEAEELRAGLLRVCFVWEVKARFLDMHSSGPLSHTLSPFAGQDLSVALAAFKLTINSCLHPLRAAICYCVFWGLIFIYCYPCI